MQFKTSTIYIFLLLLGCISCKTDDDLVPNIPDPDITYTLKIENDILIPMRDGGALSSNVYRPEEAGEYPVIISLGPYGKDDLPAEYDPEDDGIISVSPYAAFEMPDPEFWVKHGYVVIAIDSRGTGKSAGTVNLLEDKEAEDYYDAIEWAGQQDWSNGNVGLNGVSYFGIAQWKVAALQPPSLKAIIPWEGFTDMYRDGARHGGIPSPFIDNWFEFRILENLSPGNTGYRDLPVEIGANTLATANIYTDLDASSILSKITVPAYIAVSIQDHALHTRGTIHGFQQISSTNKWLELHGRKKWEYYYSEAAVSRQKKFFDQFLKEQTSGIMNQPSVRYELREAFYQGTVKTANTWPIPNRTLQKLFLNADDMAMVLERPMTQSTTSYDATPIADPEAVPVTDDQRAIFTYTFTEDTDIVGTMKLNLFVSTDQANDIDLFVGIQKEDAAGNTIYFQGPAEDDGQVASGWLRVSQRALDTSKSTEEIPFHAHTSSDFLTPGEIVEVQVEIWPSTTTFKQGEKLRLVIQGNDIKESQEEHKDNNNSGHTTIHTGGTYHTYLQIPTLQQ